MTESMVRPVRDPEDRFWEKVDIRDFNGCWVWTAAKSTCGYGRFGMGRKGTGQVQAHRLSYEWLVGPIPPGMQLDHVCRVRSCVNPEHLRIVTNAQNSQHITAYKSNKLGIRGVYWSKKDRVYYAQVKVMSKVKTLWGFSTPEEAEAAVIKCRNDMMTHNDLDRGK